MEKRKIKKECGRRNFLKGGKMKEQKKLYKELGHTLLQGNLVYHLLCQEKGRNICKCWGELFNFSLAQLRSQSIGAICILWYRTPIDYNGPAGLKSGNWKMRSVF